jgi:hypothetical protein
VGSNPARLIHRTVGRWPGNNCHQTACGGSICLHGEGPLAEDWGEYGGRSFDSIEDVPDRYRVCWKCVAADETVSGFTRVVVC